MAVAGFGQLLRHDPWLSPEFSWDEVAEIGGSAKGVDADGTRAEFLEMVGKARVAAK